MKKSIVLTICFIFPLLGITFGQGHEYKLLNVPEKEVLNDLSYAFQDKSDSYIISPFIVSPNYRSTLKNSDLCKKFGFNRKQLKNSNGDTLILNSNNYFKIINPDSLLKYQKISRDTTMLIRDPLLYSIELNYGKMAICYFQKVVLSKNKDYALVEYWIYCGFLCGYGETVIMKKIDNNWIIFETLAKSVS
jgi:hypothetical protein